MLSTKGFTFLMKSLLILIVPKYLEYFPCMHVPIAMFPIACLQPQLGCVHKRFAREVNKIQSKPAKTRSGAVTVSVPTRRWCVRKFKLRETFFASAINVLSLLALYFFPCSVLCCCFVRVVRGEEENNRIDTWAGKLKRLYSSFRLMRCIICLCVLYLHDSLWASLSSSCYEVASTLYLGKYRVSPLLHELNNS